VLADTAHVQIEARIRTASQREDDRHLAREIDGGRLRERDPRRQRVEFAGVGNNPQACLAREVLRRQTRGTDLPERDAGFGRSDAPGEQREKNDDDARTHDRGTRRSIVARPAPHPHIRLPSSGPRDPSFV
jgi:hypothetical protein